MKILFIGNSYTYRNDMPDIFFGLLQGNGIDAEVSAVTKGGQKLFRYLGEDEENNAALTALLEKNSYDLLFLQEQSYFPLSSYPQFELGVCELTKLVSAKRTILYATWGRKTGCELLETLGLTSDEMADALEAAYRKAAAASGAEVSSVGLCFKEITKLDPTAELYKEDLSHPSYLGSCVAAVAHYRKAMGMLPEIYTNLDLDENEIKLIFKAVERVFA